jgi:hypothetical protein
MDLGFELLQTACVVHRGKLRTLSDMGRKSVEEQPHVSHSVVRYRLPLPAHAAGALGRFTNVCLGGFATGCLLPVS